jgi:hypothetical protein
MSAPSSPLSAHTDAAAAANNNTINKTTTGTPLSFTPPRSSHRDHNNNGDDNRGVDIKHHNPHHHSQRSSTKYHQHFAELQEEDIAIVKAHRWKGFSEQLDFIDRLCEMVDSLRFVDRPLRSDSLCVELTKLNADPARLLGW